MSLFTFRELTKSICLHFKKPGVLDELNVHFGDVDFELFCLASSSSGHLPVKQWDMFYVYNFLTKFYKSYKAGISITLKI